MFTRNQLIVVVYATIMCGAQASEGSATQQTPLQQLARILNITHPQGKQFTVGVSIASADTLKPTVLPAARLECQPESWSVVKHNNSALPMFTYQLRHRHGEQPSRELWGPEAARAQAKAWQKV